MTIYHDVLMDHYKNPRNFGCKNCVTNATSHMHNPSCGDKIFLKLKVDGGVIENICFEGYGCALSTASASMLSEHVKGKKVSDAKKTTIDDVKKMLAIDVSSVRLKCASLPLEALLEALNSID